MDHYGPTARHPAEKPAGAATTSDEVKLARLLKVVEQGVTWLLHEYGGLPANEKLNFNVDWQTGSWRLGFSGEVTGSMYGSLIEDEYFGAPA